MSYMKTKLADFIECLNEIESKGFKEEQQTKELTIKYLKSLDKNDLKNGSIHFNKEMSYGDLIEVNINFLTSFISTYFYGVEEKEGLRAELNKIKEDYLTE